MTMLITTAAPSTGTVNAGMSTTVNTTAPETSYFIQVSSISDSTIVIIAVVAALAVAGLGGAVILCRRRPSAIPLPVIHNDDHVYTIGNTQDDSECTYQEWSDARGYLTCVDEPQYMLPVADYLEPVASNGEYCFIMDSN
jgi:hypothetical protein